jgi:Protein of unknown function (DUF1549)/Protein of unknown function (DUF1553)
MWLRNLLFLGVIGGAAYALGANLLPPRQASSLTSYDDRAYRESDFLTSVGRLDDSFHRQWSAEGLTPAAPATELVVARRLALALAGTVPSLEEIRQFEALPAAERLPWYLDHLLQDRRFADYFAERFARAWVGTEDGPFIFYRRRRLVSWLSEQLAQNRPYDGIVRDLIASDGLWTDSPATNFVSVTVQPDNQNQPDPVRLAGRVTRAFLGLRLDCAQCHDHPFADWKQADFQGLSAFFGQTHVGFTGIHDGDGEYVAEQHKSKEKRVVTPHVPFAPELLPAVGTRRQQLAAWITSPSNSYFSRSAVNRVWALLAGRPLLEPVDNLEADASAPALPPLADDFAAHNFDLRRLIRLIASSQVYRLDSAGGPDDSEPADKAWAIFPLTRLRPEQVVGGVMQAASVTTIDSESHILIRLVRFGSQNDFVKRYGDSGEDEFDGHGGTIPQRLLLMNGKIVHERTKADITNASARIAWMAPDNQHALEAAYLAVLTRRPTKSEADFFTQSLPDRGPRRAEAIEDLCWTLINSTEFSWNH